MKNSGQVGITAAELMDKLDSMGYGEEAEIAETIIVCRVQGKDADSTDENDFGWSFIQWRSSDPVWSHQLGLLEGALEGMRNSRAQTMQDESGDEDDTDNA